MRMRLEEEADLADEASEAAGQRSLSAGVSTPPRGLQSEAIVSAALKGRAPKLPTSLDLWREMEWRGNAGTSSRGFSTEADRLIALTAVHQGLGRYGAMRVAMASSERLRFDYYARSRNAEELEQRSELVLRALERDLAEDIRQADLDK